eukprot:CAMPEP_0201914216 /NCGR_PEP_ID=MMETSP0903-20130614/4451_1 /ASSEMBLY_ACC=CAM_ASM_000552 /TAXON_ID=420261 /ORGANISM="Thalassiosira antarctica, Strain CCMP982" /LENGTH=45 /DNA_ID= /DNA_START= /DNA_END= /DNA_ORIENTATION=
MWDAPTNHTAEDSVRDMAQLAKPAAMKDAPTKSRKAEFVRDMEQW